MNFKITDHLFGCSSLSLGGIKNIFLTDRAEIHSFFFSTGDTQLTTITDIQTVEDYNTSISLDSEEIFDGWFQLKAENSTFFTQNKNSGKNREQHTQTLNCTFTIMSPSKRDRFTELVNSRTVILFQDKNNRWYCMGDTTLGCKVVDSNHQTGSNEEVNFMNVVFQCISKHSIRFIHQDYIDDNVIIYTAPISDCSCESLIDNPLIINGSCELIDLLSCPLS